VDASGGRSSTEPGIQVCRQSFDPDKAVLRIYREEDVVFDL
jgi:hypothetical protein